jgi:hypothetical protein
VHLFTSELIAFDMHPVSDHARMLRREGADDKESNKIYGSFWWVTFAEQEVGTFSRAPKKGCACGISSIVELRFHCAASINARMSATFHALILGPNLTGRGYLPALIPAHQLDLLIG